MRLIDADELTKDENIHELGCELAIPISIVEEAKTIEAEPIRHGRWLVQNDFWRKCSECEATWHEQWVMGKALNYCPNCGAKMDETT